MYETVRVEEEAPIVKTVESRGWASKYRLVSTVVKQVVTQIVSVLLAPDGTTEVTRYVLPTRYIEKEIVRNVVTQYVGVVQASPQPAPGGGGLSVR